MHRETGVVIEVSGTRALVESEASSFCSSCEARGACVSKDDKKKLIWMDNGPGAAKGDCVVYEISEGDVVLSSVMLYLFPVAALIGGAGAGYSLHGLLGLDRDLGAGVFGLAALAASFVIIRIVSRFLLKRGIFSVNMLEIQKKAD